MAPMEEFIRMGVSVVGGCCGTTPEFIARLAAFSGREVEQPEPAYETVVTSATRRVVLKGARICGERLNPTGKKKLKEALLERGYGLSRARGDRPGGGGGGTARSQRRRSRARRARRHGARRGVQLQEATDLPLQIDSSDPKAIEAGVRRYSGVPLVNSVNGEGAVMDAVFPIVKEVRRRRPGAHDGSERACRGRPRSALRSLSASSRAPKSTASPAIRVMIDTLVLTASAEQPLVKETLKALTLVRNLGVQTALGVSNVSFGLPDRPRLNRAFLAAALQAGLTMPIMNPLGRRDGGHGVCLPRALGRR